MTIILAAPHSSERSDSAATGRRAFNRPPRLPARLSLERFDVPVPPLPVARASGSIVGRLFIPLLTALASGGIFFLFALSSTGDQRTLMLIAAGAMLLVAALPTAWMFFEDRRNYKRSSRAQRLDFETRMTAARERLAALRQEERTLRTDQDPPPEVLRARAEQPSPRLWERRPTDADFLRLRLGRGTAPSLVRVVFDPRSAELETELARAASELAADFGVAHDVPIVADLKPGALGIAGPAQVTAALARSAISQAATLHSPDELWLAAFVRENSLADWAWLKWLPHTRPRRTSEPGRALLAWDNLGQQQLARWLLGELTTRQRAADEYQARGQRHEAPWLLVFIEDFAALQVDPAVQQALATGPALRVAVMGLAEHTTQLPDRCLAQVELGPVEHSLSYRSTNPDTPNATASPDRTSVAEADAIARALAPLVPVRPAGRGETEIPSRVGFFETVGITSVDDLDHTREWHDRELHDLLRIPLGIATAGKLVELDLKEQALGGHGPHGLVAGTTGAGKSELLLTMIAGLAMRHPPDVLNFVLVDYKGGDAFRAVANLPHTVALITDLDRHLASRALVALKSELKRRERRMGDLKEAGVTSVAEYQSRRGDRPMPFLVIVVDEFARLKDELPEFIHGLVDVARVGRSLGVHLILATQTPSGTVDDEIQKNVNFGICLRVRDAFDSRSVIGEPDAALLPGSLPGRAYLRVGLDPIQLFQTARVGGRYEAQDEHGAIDLAAFAPEPGHASAEPARPTSTAPDDTARHSEIDVLAEHLAAVAADGHLAAVPWPEPLPSIVALFDGAGGPDATGPSVVGPLRAVDGPWQWSAPPQPDWLVAPIGMADEPVRQEQHPIQIDVARNVLVVGASGAGKSTLLRTLAVSLALTHSPTDLHIYCLDFGARSLRVLAGLPHCGADGVFFATDPDRVRRLFRLLARELERRRQAGATNLRQHRRAQPDDRRFPFLLVLLDNYPAFREAFDDGSRSRVVDNVLGDLIALMRDGPAVGISFVVTSSQLSGITSGVLNAAETRIVLRQNDPTDYSFVGRIENPPDHVEPGRGFATGTPPTELQVAVPAPPDAPADGAAALADLLEHLRAASAGFAPLAVEELPQRVALDDVRLARHGALPGLVLMLGLEDESGALLNVDLDSDAAHLIVAGPPGGGKTTLLATMLLSTRGTSATWYLAGSRRSALLELASAPQCAQAAQGIGQIEDLMDKLETLVDERRETLHGDAAAHEAVAPVLVVFDDYDLLRQDDDSGRLGSALSRIARRGGAVGIHVIIACSNVELRGSYDDLIRYLTQVRAGVLLQPDLEFDGDVFSIRLRSIGEGAPPPGRGYLILRQMQHVFQAATAQREGESLAAAIRAQLG